MPSSKKQIAFDLDTKALEKYYPTENWRNAYQDIRRDMEDNGFAWQQGSVYTSLKPVPHVRASQVLEQMIETHPWLNVCVRDCVVTNIGKEHSKNNIFDKTVEIPERTTIKARIEEHAQREDTSAEANAYQDAVKFLKESGVENPIVLSSGGENSTFKGKILGFSKTGDEKFATVQIEKNQGIQISIKDKETDKKLTELYGEEIKITLRDGELESATVADESPVTKAKEENLHHG